MSIPRPAFARVVFIIASLAIFTFGCFAPKAERKLTAGARDNKRIFVVHNNWHTAIVAKAADIAVSDIPELAHFSNVQYFEISWGDADYFPTADAGIGLALKAVLWSSGSVVHVVGFSSPVKDTYRGAEVIEIELSDREFHRLIGFVSAEFRRRQPGQPADPGPGLFPHSRFYPANSKFGLFNNCNTWVAEAFRAAGLPITVYIFTAGSIADKIKTFGTVQ